LTTLIGFLSLQSHVLPPAQELGILVSFGIAIAFLQCISFLPAALCLLPSPVFKSGRQSTKLLNDRNLNRWGILLVRFRNYILIVTVLVILGVATGIPRVRIDTNPVNFFNWKSEFRQASEFIDREFGGSSQIALLAEGDIKDPDFLKEMEKVTAYLQTKPMVTQVTSIVDQLKMMNKAFHGDSVAYKIIPATRDKVAQYLFLYSITGDSKDLDRFVDYDYERAQIMARVRETGSTEAHRLYLEILDFLQREMNPAHFPAVTGMAAFIGVLAEMVVKGQIWSLLASIVLVFLCTALIFRSFSAGLLSIMPLSGAIILLFGLMGYLNIHLDMATVMLSSIMIGVGVDYTVHYIYRYRREVGLGASIQEAVPLTIRTSGKGILYNALSVIIGFAVLLLSGFVPIYFFGFLIVLSIVACLLGALILIPVVTLIIKPAFIKKRRKNEALAR
jgi:predicted RND superfamily exporter protein